MSAQSVALDQVGTLCVPLQHDEEVKLLAAVIPHAEAGGYPNTTISVELLKVLLKNSGVDIGISQ